MARMLSMRPDKSDDHHFRHGIQMHEGTDVGDITVGNTYKYGQIYPYFFTNEGAAVYLDGIYRGSSCFLIGGGPSLLKEDVTQLYRPGIFTFGMNNSVKVVRPNMWSCVDDPARFLFSVWTDPKIMKFVPQSAFRKQLWNSTFIEGKQIWQEMPIHVGDCPNVLGFRRNDKFCAKRFLTEDTINWGCHKDFGGCRSVMLSSLRILFILGFRRVFLVGVDLKMDEEHKYSFSEGRSPGAIKNNNHTYQRMLADYFPNLKPEFDKWGFQLFCCNKESDLCKIFPHMSYTDAVKAASAHLGDTTQEKTEGMYLTLEEKRALKTWEACVKATQCKI